MSKRDLVFNSALTAAGFSLGGILYVWVTGNITWAQEIERLYFGFSAIAVLVLVLWKEAK